jgi:integrase
MCVVSKETCPSHARMVLMSTPERSKWTAHEWRLCLERHSRHTFATRALERCSTQRARVARHFVALATYMGHTDIAHTYWYQEAAPELMTDIAAAAEALIAGEGR